MPSRVCRGRRTGSTGKGLLDFCVYFYVLALLLKRKAGRRKPDGTAYQPKIECSAPEKPLQQMTGVGQVNMIFFRFKPTLLFLIFFSCLLPVGCNSTVKAMEKKDKWERIQGASYKKGQIMSCF